MSVTIVQTCQKCFGSGVYYKDTPNGMVEENPCPLCDGSKVFELCRVHLPSGVFRGDEVFEAIDQTEYDALTGTQASKCDKVLSCAMVNLNTGSRARTILAGLFGAGTTTRANLQALLDG